MKQPFEKLMQCSKKGAANLGIIGLCGALAVTGCSPTPLHSETQSEVELIQYGQPEIALASAGTSSSPVGEGKKHETVFVTLDASGKPTEVIVTDRLTIDQRGGSVKDITSLTDVVPVKGGNLVSQAGGSVVWELEDTDLYYQGKSDRDLPLEVDIRYRLDGKDYPPEELAGRSGQLEIQIDLRNHLCHKVEIDNKLVDMTAPLTVVLGMVLPDDVFRDVELSDGTLTADGNNQIVTISSMPGLEESLNIKSFDLPGLDDLDFPSSFTITATVTDFELGPVYIGVTTDFPELDMDTEEIEDMRTDLGELKNIQDDLAQSDPDRQIRSIFMDPWMTRGAQIMVDDIFDFYDMDKRLLDILPDHVTDENIALYDRLKEHTDGLDMEEALFGDTADALFDFLEGFSREDAERLLDSKDMMDRMTYDYSNLLDNDITEDLIAYSIDMLMSARSSKQQLAALSALSKAITPQQIDGLIALYKQSGLASLDLQTLDQMLALYDTARQVGLTQITPEELSNLLTFYQTSGLAQCSDQLPALMAQIQSMGGLNLDQWQTFFTAGLKAVASGLAETPVQEEPPAEPPAEAPQQEAEDTPEAEDSTPTQEDPTGEEVSPQDSGDADTGEEAAPDETLEDTLESEGVAEPEDSTEAEPAQEPEPASAAEEPAGIEASTAPKPSLMVRAIALTESEKSSSTQAVPAGRSTADEIAIDTAALRQLMAGLQSVASNSARALQPYGYDLTNSTHRAQLIGAARGLAGDAQSVIGLIDDLQDDKKTSRELEEFMENMADPKTPSRLRRLAKDLKCNQKNLNLAEELLRNPYIDLDVYTGFKDRSKELRKLLKDSEGLYTSLRDDLDSDEMQESLHNSPETVRVLMKMKDDLEYYRKVSEALSITVRQDNADMFARMFSTLDRLEAEGAIDRYVGQVDDILELIARKDAYVELSDQYQIFTSAPQGFETEVRFVMKTDSIKIPGEPKESKEETPDN